jgi:hypothetical protein
MEGSQLPAWEAAQGDKYLLIGKLKYYQIIIVSFCK